MWTAARAMFDRQRSLLRRVALVPVFVAVCHLYDWPWLRAATMATLVEVSRVLGVPMHRVGWDLAELNGAGFQVVVACTMIDAYCGALPLLWRTSAGLHRNLFRLGAVFGGVFLLNIVRLEAGFVGLTRGVPWWLGHECVAGVTYFCLLLFIARERAWAGAQTPTASVGRRRVRLRPIYPTLGS